MTAGDDDEDNAVPSLLTRRLSPSFDRRVVVIPPGSARAYHESEWRDAIVIVEQGQIELAEGGNRRRFVRGGILVLDGMSLSALHNPGQEPAVLVAVSRRVKARDATA